MAVGFDGGGDEGLERSSRGVGGVAGDGEGGAVMEGGDFVGDGGDGGEGGVGVWREGAQGAQSGGGGGGFCGDDD